MKRLFVLLPLALLAASIIFAQTTQLFDFYGSVSLAPANPEFTMVDPFSQGLTPSNPLKPKRPFWYSVDKEGITIIGLRTEMTGALQVGGTPIQVTENVIVNRVLWPDAIAVVQPDGEIAIDPSVLADHDKFAWRPDGGWEPVGITASYPTDEALASNSETPSTFVYVVMKHSGLEWASSITGDPTKGIDPNLRDTIRPATSPDTESSLLVQIDVSDPTYPVLFYAMGPPIGGALLGHDAGPPVFDPAIDSVYVGNMPSTSLPAAPTVTSTPTNFALAANGGVASASSTYSNGYPPSGANDGDRGGLNWENGGGWNDATAGTFPDWLQIDFAGSQTINEIDVFTVQDTYLSPTEPSLADTFTLYGMTAFDVQYWDGSSWITVPNGNITSNNHIWTQLTFSPLTTSKIRVQVNDALANYSRITEVEAWGASNNPLPDLTSFVSVVAIAPPELPVPGETPAPVTVTVLCGPEHPDIPLLVGVPQSWACIGEGGEGPFEWNFTGLPGWLIAHVDPLTGQKDGILYGTPPTAGSWTFDISVLDHATDPPGTGTATVTLLTTTDPTTEYEYGELEFEVGTPAGVAIEGTRKPGTTGDLCALTPTASPGSIVPSWIQSVQIIGPGRTIDNTSVGGPIENTTACVVMGTPPISGEYYEFKMPNFQFTWPSQNLPIVFSGQVFGPYNFDPLPAGVGLNGLAWHEINKIHDPSTEADLLNRELFGVEPGTGQMYRIVPAYAGLEAEGSVVPPPSLQGELDEVEPFADLLTPLTTARPDIAEALAGNTNLKVMFGNVAAEAKYDPNVFVTAYQLSDPTGVDPTVIPIGGPTGSAIENGVVINVQAARPLDPEVVTVVGTNVIDIPAMQVYGTALDSDLRPAVRSGAEAEPGQFDNGYLWLTGMNTGKVAVVDTTTRAIAQVLTVPDATSLGGTWVNANTRLAYVTGKTLQTVLIIGATSPTPIAPVVMAHPSNQTVTIGQTAIFTAGASGMPIPAVQWQINTGGGWSDITGAVSTQFTTETATVYMNGYQYRAVFTNSQGSATSNAATLTVAGAQAAPVVTTHPLNLTVTAGQTATFSAAATGDPTPTVQWELSTNGGSSFSPIGSATDPSYTTGVTTTAMNGYQYRAVFTNSQGTATTNAAMLTVNAPLTAPTVTQQPTNQAVTVGQTATFTAAADGNPAPTVHWQLSTNGGLSFTNIAGGNTLSYQTSSTTLSMSGYQYRAVFTNSQGSVNSSPATLTVNPSATAPSVTTPTMDVGTVGQRYTYQLGATGGTSPYTWSLARRNRLPNGLSLASTGVISGTPKQAGSFAFVVQVTDTGGQTADGSVTVTINPRPPRQSLDAGPAVDPKTADVNLESKEVLK